jgi:hypothetical protein
MNILLGVGQGGGEIPSGLNIFFLFLNTYDFNKADILTGPRGIAAYILVFYLDPAIRS